MSTPLMPMATAVWLIDNTTLTFEQIGAFCGVHTLEVQAIADGDIVVGMQGRDPIAAGELTFEEIARCQADSEARLVQSPPTTAVPKPKKRSRYIPLSKRQDKPSAILWLIKEHPEIPDSHIVKILSTTAATIKSIRGGTHKGMESLTPKSPSDLGLCTTAQLQELIAGSVKASSKKAK